MLKERLKNVCEITDLATFEGIEDAWLLSVPNGEKIGGLFLLDKSRLQDLNHFFCSGLWLEKDRLFWSIQHMDHFRRVCLEPTGERWLEMNFLGSFTRGLAITPKYIYVGLSRRRTESYITKDTIGSAGIAVLDFSTLEHLRTVYLPVRQIYDILLLPEV